MLLFFCVFFSSWKKEKKKAPSGLEVSKPARIIIYIKGSSIWERNIIHNLVLPESISS